MAATAAVNRRSATAVSSDSPASIPTVRATTASALALPCTSAPVAPSSTVLTGAIASPNPSPAANRTTNDAAPSSDCAPQVVITTNATAARAIPPAATTAAARRQASRRRRRRPARRPAAGAAPGRRPLVARCGGVAGEQRDVDQRGDQGDPDQQVDQQRPPGADRPQRPQRQHGVGRPALVQHEGDGRGEAERQQHRAVRDDLRRRVGGGERPDQAAQGHDDQRRPQDVDLAGQPAADRAAAGRRPPGPARLRTTRPIPAARATSTSGVVRARRSSTGT